MFYLMTHSKHFIYDYMASGIWMVREIKPTAAITWTTLFN